MVRTALKSRCWQAGILILASCTAAAQTNPPTHSAATNSAAETGSASGLVNSGNLTIDGKAVPYLVRHLPPSSFPDLPQPIREELESRGCIIPQTYEAHQPENVVHASLQQAGSTDWAVLCSIKGTVSLMVFFSSAPTQPIVLASAPETEHLQRNTATGVFGFNWAIDPATPQRIREAATGQRFRPPMLDHDALADSIIDRRTVYHYYANNAWILLDVPER